MGPYTFHVVFFAINGNVFTYHGNLFEKNITKFNNQKYGVSSSVGQSSNLNKSYFKLNAKNKYVFHILDNFKKKLV